jgi:antitoxin VapB
MLHLSPETEALAHRIAKVWHVPVEKAIKLALEASARIAAEAPAGDAMSKEELIRRMEDLSVRAGARPIVDPRSPDELLGYDEFGLPK